MTWLGLELSFYTLRRKGRQCAADSAFGAASLTRPWVTDRGLRRGDPVSKIKRLYSRSRPAGRSSVWLIVKTSPAIGDYGLSVRVVDGRATTLDLDYPLGGE